MRKMTPNVKDEHTGSFSYIKEAHVKENGEENGKRGCMAKWACILGVNLPQKSKTFFPKNGFSPSSNFLSHPLPISMH